MKKVTILLSLFTFVFAYNGSITGVTYFDYTRENDASAFNFNRQYFSYSIDMSNDAKFKVVFDVGRTNKATDELENNIEDTRLVTFLKKAQLDHKCEWGMTNLGLIGTNTYGIQEKNWGYRFIEKSALDKNKFVSTADLGVGVSMNFLNNFNVGIQYLNGEGYKSPEINYIQKINLNVNYGETNLSKNSGANLGVVYSSELTEDSPLTLFSLYGGFAFRGIRFGTELDISDEKALTSVYLNYLVNRKVSIFSRYDVLEEDSDKDKFFISGLVYNCGSGILISPNIRKSNKDELVYKLNFQFTF
ncbi:MAG: hypothetical protein HN820_01335 [Candidatus Marinimicrobia bacterium]|nr:hypothetical protein [Candidatus Neomarinimicrobiota bacterium]MBT7376779.1 hypothetical protein [Candidatus Neomarinimicrobiota bacterium]